MKPGDAIPKELEIASDLEVSRTVVREALLRLRTLGIVDSKKHRGMILKEPDLLLNLERIMNPTMLSNKVLKDIFELRLVLEVGMADLLFEKINSQDLVELEQIVNESEMQNGHNQTIFSSKFEIQFHGKLYKISGNKTLLRFQSMLFPVFEFVSTNHFDEPYDYPNGFVSHRDLFEILKNGSPETFSNAMRRHLEPHFKRNFQFND